MTLTEIINTLSKISSKNEKESFLLSHKDNKDLMKVFEVTYSKTLNFFVRGFKPDTSHKGLTPLMESIHLLLENIASRVYTGNDAKSYMTQLVQTCKEPELLVKIINRDLECGVQQVTINKIWKDLVLDPPYMSYKLFKPELFKKIKFPAYSEVKQDGLYVDTIVYKDSILYRSRSGKELNFTLPEPVERKLRELAEYPGEPYVLHGEALVIDGTQPNGVQPREIGNGYLNQDSENIDENLVKIVVWDMVSLEEYKKRKSDTVYEERKDDLERVVNYVDSHHLESGEYIIVKNINEVISHFKSCRKRGLEGTIVKDKNLLWEDKKVSKGIKLKNEFEAEYRVVGYIPHKKKENWIGSLLVESEDGKVSFGVGSGLTDKLRQLPFEHYNQKIISVKGNDLVQSEVKDTWSVFLPRFVELRDDKTKANTFEEIMEQKDSIIFILEKCGESQ